MMDEFTRMRKVKERDPERFFRILSKLTGIPPEELKEKVRKATEAYVISEITGKISSIKDMMVNALDECEKLEAVIRDNLDREDFAYETILPILLNEVIPNLETVIEALSHVLNKIEEYVRETDLSK